MTNFILTRGVEWSTWCHYSPEFNDGKHSYDTNNGLVSIKTHNISLPETSLIQCTGQCVHFLFYKLFSSGVINL